MTDQAIAREPGRAAAAQAVERLTFAIINSSAARRQGEGRGNGARAPAGIAQPRRSLDVLTAPEASLVRSDKGQWDVTPRQAPVTPLNYKTAMRALPPLLAGLGVDDPRRRAALMIADAVERIGSVKGADLGGDAPKGGVSDGGVTTRVKYAARLRLVEIAANGWPRAALTSRAHRGPERVVLPVRKRKGNIREIKAMDLVEALCVEGQDMRQILAAHGWSGKSDTRKRLGAAALLVLDDVAETLGLGRADPDNRLDA